MYRVIASNLPSSGKLLIEKANIEKVYLIGTNQNSEVREREKDTLYAWVSWSSAVEASLHRCWGYSSGVMAQNPLTSETDVRWWQQFEGKYYPAKHNLGLSLSVLANVWGVGWLLGWFVWRSHSIFFLSLCRIPRQNQVVFLNYTGPF